MNRDLRHLTASARDILQRAEQSSRELGHSFIGTEHILLALVDENAGSVSSALKASGVDLAAILREVERLVSRGTEPIAAAPLPLTPRVRHAMELADDEAATVGLTRADAECLVLGLMREPDGVAGVILRNLSVPFHMLRESLLRIRLQQMQIVERCVRPVRAGTPRKRKMREEMLAHFTAIYEAAREHNGDPSVALHEATRRFGNPADLARELDAALPRSERRAYYIERWLSRRPHETEAARIVRLSWQLALALAVLCSLGILGRILVSGSLYFPAEHFFGVAAYLVLQPTMILGVGILSVKMRDAMFGGHGRRKSLQHVLLYDMAIASVMLTGCLAFVAANELSIAAARQWLIPLATLSAVTSIAAFLIVRTNGAAELRDAFWAGLDLGETADANRCEPA